MLYLMRDSRGAKKLVKIGRTKDIEQRMTMYECHNPFAKLVQSVETDNDKKYEEICHFYLEQNGYKQVHKTEWYEVPKGCKNYHFKDIEEEFGFKFKSITTYRKR